MAATTPKALTGSNLLDTLPSSSKIYVDGDLYYVVMAGKTRMRIMLRTKDEYFSTFVDREAVNLGMDVVINGNFYDINKTSKFWAVMGTSSDASNTTPEGFLIESQAVIGGISRPNHFYVAQLMGPIWTFGFGDPGSSRTLSAIGGLGPLIINGLNYGDGNLYKAGAPANAPTTGAPPAAAASFLIQRNNETFKDANNKGAAVGKTVIAYAPVADKLVVLIQPNGASTGITLEDLRDKLAAVGVNSAVFLDGSDSSMLWVNGIWQISPGSRKNHTNTIGVAFDIP